MKYFATIACSLLLIGCGDSAQNTPPAVSQSETPAPIQPAAESNAASETPAAPEAASAAPAMQSSPAQQAVAAVETSAGVDGSALFAQKCASCHGMKAEKSALGKSQVIAGWSESQIKDALKGYQGGTYGKEMKALMQGQVKGLNDAQISALAKHVSGL